MKQQLEKMEIVLEGTQKQKKKNSSIIKSIATEGEVRIKIPKGNIIPKKLGV